MPHIGESVSLHPHLGYAEISRGGHVHRQALRALIIKFHPNRRSTPTARRTTSTTSTSSTFFRSSSAVNPALTAMANALRVGDHLLERLGATGEARTERTVAAPA